MKTLRRIVILAALVALILAALMLFGVLSLPAADSWIARILAAVSGMLVLGGTALEARDAKQSWQLPEPEDPPTSVSVIQTKPPAEEAIEKIEEAESFSRRATDKVRIKIDIEDARED